MERREMGRNPLLAKKAFAMRLRSFCFEFVCDVTFCQGKTVNDIMLHLVTSIPYFGACSHYTDFIYRSVLLTQKLLQQSYEEDRLKLTLRKFYGHHHELVDPYDVSLIKLAKDIFTTW